MDSKLTFGYGVHHTQKYADLPNKPAARNWSAPFNTELDPEEIVDAFLKGPQGSKRIAMFNQYNGYLAERWRFDDPGDRHKDVYPSIVWDWLDDEDQVVGHAYVYTNAEQIDFWIMADDLSTCNEMADALDKWYLECGFEPDAPENAEDEAVSVAFWNLSANGPHAWTDQLKCPTLEEVGVNYPDSVFEGLRWTADQKNPLDTGKLIFWMGIPGTGKTWSVRALMREWKNRAFMHVITDPELFFNHVEYLRVVMENGASDKLNLIIIEDSPRVVLQEARGTNETHAMSRLLNLTDGLWGEAKKTIFLMTTNDNIKDIDPAFLRDGRLLQRLSFRGFTPKEAVKWLEDQGVEDIPHHELESEEEIALCKLYGIMRKAGSSRIKTEQQGPMGFKCGSLLTNEKALPNKA